jgi:hypothetical protein
MLFLIFRLFSCFVYLTINDLVLHFFYCTCVLHVVIHTFKEVKMIEILLLAAGMYFECKRGPCEVCYFVDSE